MTDAAHFAMTGIFGRCDAVGIRAWRRLPARRGRLIVQRFMGSDLIVGVTERVEGALLRVQVGAGGFGRAGFEGAMHAFMGTRFLAGARA